MSNQSVLQINPTLAVSWVGNNAIRIGFDEEHSRICNPSDGICALLSSLLIGCTAGALKRSAARYRVCEEELRELLCALEPVLIRSNRPESLARLSLTEGLSCKVFNTASGSSAKQTTANVLSQLQQLGVTAKPASSGEVCAVQLVLHRFMMLPDTPADTNPELAELPLIFGDQRVRLGPFRAGAFTPCAQCVEHHYLSADGERERLARQLSQEAPATESADSLGLLLPFVRLLIQQHAAETASLAGLTSAASPAAPTTPATPAALTTPTGPTSPTGLNSPAYELVFDFYGGSLLPPRKRAIQAVPGCGCTRLTAAAMSPAAVESLPPPKTVRGHCV